MQTAASQQQQAGDWYAEWAREHCRALGFAEPSDVKAVLAWRDVLAGTFDLDTLRAATRVMLSNIAFYASLAGRTTLQAGKMAGNLAALQAAIKDARAIEYQRQEAEEPDRGTCTTCQGSGRLIVPHPASLAKANGVLEWRPVKVSRGGSSYYTASVFCSCALGRWMYTRQDDQERRGLKPQRMMTVDQYEVFNPHWRVQMEQRAWEQGKLQEAEASVTSDSASKIDQYRQRLLAAMERLRLGLKDLPRTVKDR